MEIIDVIYRVVALTDSDKNSDRNPNHTDFVLTTSSPCCCSPTVTFWLTDDGLEDPNCELITFKIPIIFINNTSLDIIHNGIDIKFHWDDSLYCGHFIYESDILRFANNIISVGRIIDVGFVL